MRKKMLFLSLSLAVVATFSVSSMRLESEMSLRLMQNVEALSDSEIIVHPLCIDSYVVCYTLDDKLGFNIIFGYE